MRRLKLTCKSDGRTSDALTFYVELPGAEANAMLRGAANLKCLCGGPTKVEEVEPIKAEGPSDITDGAIPKYLYILNTPGQQTFWASVSDKQVIQFLQDPDAKNGIVTPMRAWRCWIIPEYEVEVLNPNPYLQKKERS